MSEGITLAEHLARIRGLGGKARAERLSPKRRSAIARQGGLSGGKARAEQLTPERRREIAQAAARARWEKSGEKAE